MFWKSATMIQRMISMIKMSFSPINWQKKERKKEKSDSNQHFPLSYVKTLLARLLWTADGCTWVRLVSTCSELKVLLNIWFQRELILKLLSSAALGSYGQLCLQLSTFLRASSNEHKLLLIRLLSNQIVFGLTELNWFTWTCWTFQVNYYSESALLVTLLSRPTFYQVVEVAVVGAVVSDGVPALRNRHCLRG